MVLEVPSQFSMGQTVQSLTCSIMEKPHTGWMTDLNRLLWCFREKMSGLSAMNISREHLINIFSLLLTRVGVGKVLLLIPDADGAG